MSYANDKLYKVYVRKNMGLIVEKVKAREIVPYLPCLTSNDREEVEAKRANGSNSDAIQHLLECLKRRDNWPEEFITALEACEHTTMAEEIRAEYNSLKVQNSPKPPSPQATVVQAHVHPAPSADQPLSLPESAGDSPAAVAPPAQAAAPPEPVAQASPNPEAPVRPESPPSPGPEAAKAATSADLAPQPTQAPQATVAPHQATPPPSPSPKTPHQQATTPPPDRERPVHQEPEETSESDLLAVPGDEDVTENSQHTETMDTTSPPLDGTDGPCASLSGDDDDDDACLSKPTPLLSVQQNNEPLGRPASEVEPYSGSSDRLQFSDSTKDSEPAPQVAVAVACSGLASDSETTASLPPCQENGVVEEPVTFPHNEPEENHYESPCQSSLGEQEVLVNVVHVTEEPSIQNLDGQTQSMLHIDINVSDHPSPEKYDSQPQIVVESPSSVSPESSCHSCEDQAEEVSQGEACVSEEPQAQILNGRAASALNKEPESATPTCAVTVSIVNAPSSENCHPSEPGAVEALLELKPQGQQDPKKAPASSTSSNTKYFLTAAGVCACALFMAWKLKN